MKYSIPYGRQNIDDTDIAAAVETLRSDFLTQGPKIAEFEASVAKYHNCKYAVAFSNGTAALHAAYQVSGLQPGDEFITSPITFAASANGGLYVGGTPRFVDISAKNYLMDNSLLEKSITPKTKVVTPVSYAGYPTNLKKVRSILKGRDIKIIHDAAHAIGALRGGESITRHADMTILSFHPVKHVATGEGGMVLTDNEQLHVELSTFRTHGITKNLEELSQNDGPWYYEMHSLGYNYRITDIQCALGVSQMKKLDWSLKRRNEIAACYHSQLRDIDWLTLPPFDMDADSQPSQPSNSKRTPLNRHSYHLYAIQVKNPEHRLALFNFLRKSGIFVQVHYIPVHLMPYYQKKFGYRKGDFPVAEAFYAREISLPMYPTITDNELEYIIETIHNFTFSAA